MLNDCEYNKIKLLKQLSCVMWFIKKHAEKDADNANDVGCKNFLKALTPELEKHIAILKELICKKA